MVDWEPYGRTSHEAPDGPGAALPRVPARRLAVVTCMDSRLDPLADLGLARGDAMVLRNAGAVMTEDVEHGLELAQRNLGVEHVLLVGHTDCAAHGGDLDAVRRALAEGAVRIAERLPGLSVETRLYDLATGTVAPVG